MHSYLFLLACLTTTIGKAFAAPERRGAREHGHTACWTSMTDRPVPYKTHWTDYHSKCTKTRTTTKIVKTTLPGDTLTITSTTTVTASTSTLTDTETNTVTSTDTSTTTETTTSTTTSTIGFLPIQTTLPDSAYSGSGGPVVKRDLLDIDLPDVDVKIHSGTSPKQYPKGVTCYKSKHGHCVQTVTTVTSTSTVIALPTTTTSVETDTVYPSATTTITTTSTEVATTTTTETSTSTVTTLTTESPNCNANNFADTAGGTPIVAAGQNAGDSYNAMSTTAATALDCCLAALLVANSEIFFFDPNASSCAVVYDSLGTCPSQSTNTWTAYVAPGAAYATVGNLGCGEFNSYIEF